MFSSIGTILMLHRIAPYDKTKLPDNENLKISPEELEQTIQELKHDGAEFLSLAALRTLMRDGRRPAKKAFVFTLDDGYKDNLEHGYPVFRRHNVPFCIYVTNSFPNQTSSLWWYALEDLVRKNATLRHPDGMVLKNENSRSKRQNFLNLRQSVLNEHFRDPLGFFRQCGEFDFDLPREQMALCLTWEEIRKLSADPLVTIGAHTMNHYPLSKLGVNEMELEIKASKDELESTLGRKIVDFAFPFGGKREAGAREYAVTATLGFDTIVTTVHGHIYPKDDLKRLDRIFLYPRGDSSLNKILYWNVKSAVSTIRKIV